MASATARRNDADRRAPGENEDLQGEPFVGQAGKLLDNMLVSLGLRRGRNVFIANVLKCRPPGNRNPEPAEVEQCEPFLKQQIALVRPRVIVVLGRFAAQSLLRTTTPIGKLRGTVHSYEGIPVVVTYHPAYLLRTLTDKRAHGKTCAWPARYTTVRELRPDLSLSHGGNGVHAPVPPLWRQALSQRTRDLAWCTLSPPLLESLPGTANGGARLARWPAGARLPGSAG